jgi:peptidoglycan hydrolase-like protein with peptidoglycan-binding domain
MKRYPAALTVALFLLLALPALASAATIPVLPGGGGSPAPKTKPKPKPAHMYLSLDHAIKAGHNRLALTGRAVTVSGVLSPYVSGQTVVVKISRDGRRIGTKRLKVAKSRSGKLGKFSLKVSSGTGGRLTVSVVHAGNSKQRRAAKSTQILVYRPLLRRGSSNLLVAVMQRQLAGEGYPTPKNGSFGGTTARAVLAFNKNNGFARNSTADRRVIGMLLAERGGFHVRYPGHGRHVEADLSKQVLAEIDGSHVHAVYVTSSGKPSTPTVLGTFRFYRKQPGTNSHEMVDSTYFHGGYAIHGYKSVPTYNASHGCLRIPIADARTVYNWTRIGDIIDVYP